MHKCNHKAVQWLAWENGLYRMYCASCGKYLGAESYMPLAIKGFVEETQMDIEKYETYKFEEGNLLGSLVLDDNGFKSLLIREKGRYVGVGIVSEKELVRLKEFVDNAIDLVQNHKP